MTSIVLPAPELAARNGGVQVVKPVLHTLLVEPDRGRMTAVWRGCGRALRRYAPHELTTMPMRVTWRGRSAWSRRWTAQPRFPTMLGMGRGPLVSREGGQNDEW